jgi:predicted metal-dependent hydrolase
MARVPSRVAQPRLPFDGGVADAGVSRRSTRRERAGPPIDRAVGSVVTTHLTPPGPPDSPIAYVLVRSPRARRYILRLRPDGVVRVTIPPRGSRREALDVIERHRPWIERQWRQRLAERRAQDVWDDGTRILFRGREVLLSVQRTRGAWRIRFGEEVVLARSDARIRDAVERRLRELAERELEPRLRTFAARHGLVVRQVTVRNQRTRWGSCSRRGTISLNWRLVQMPPFVSDYILLHELMHLRQANHSRRFWREVEGVCPEYREAETWLRRTGRSLW